MSVKLGPTLEALVPELREIVLREGFDPSRLSFGMPVKESSRVVEIIVEEARMSKSTAPR